MDTKRAGLILVGELGVENYCTDLTFEMKILKTIFLSRCCHLGHYQSVNCSLLKLFFYLFHSNYGKTEQSKESFTRSHKSNLAGASAVANKKALAS